ncbi:MAG: M20/M25/M40 family metallo-hydrolase [Alphaproteobacteria bacterium]|jgi:glutamate carboxypeptidase|nr:M20/M25/M40 family metallo-hydrolase [Alphaproteobacteria bacterium]
MFTELDLTSYLEDLKYLTSIDSPTGHVAGINKMIDFFTKKSKALGLQAIRKNYNQESGDCLLITNASIEEDLDILMLAHMDTVYEVGTAKKRPFNIVGNKAFAPGVIDDKGGALLGLYAMKHMDLSQLKVALLLNSNEEEGSKNNRIFIEETASRSKYVLTLEATRVSKASVDKRFGMATYKMSFFGKPATIYNFKEGFSPIYEVSKFVRSLEMLNSNNTGSLVNVVVLPTSQQDINSIQPDLHLGLQARFAENRFFENLETKINQQQEKLPDNLQMKVEKVSYYPCMPQTFKQKELKKMVENAGNNHNWQISWESSFGGADSCFASLAENCIVVDGMGPLGANFHHEQEYLDISSVEPKCNILIDVANQIIKQRQMQIQKEEQLEKTRLLREQREKELKEKQNDSK